MNVLITSAGRKVALVQAFQKAVRRYRGSVIAVDSSPFAAALFASDQACRVPPFKSSVYIPSLLRIVRRFRIRLVIPTNDDELLLMAKSKKRFFDAGAAVMVADPDTIRICADKAAFARFCAERGFPAPRTFSQGDVRRGTVRYPLFINSRSGKGSRSAFRARSVSEARLLLWTIKDPIIQEYVSLPEYTIDYCADFEGRPVSAVPRARLYTFGGESYVGRTEKNNVLIESAVRLGQALGLIGHNTIQCFWNGKHPLFIEVNPRFGGGANLGFAAGVPTPRYLVALARGERVPSRLGKFTDGLVMLRHAEDMFIPESDLKKISLRDHEY